MMEKVRGPSTFEPRVDERKICTVKIIRMNPKSPTYMEPQNQGVGFQGQGRGLEPEGYDSRPRTTIKHEVQLLLVLHITYRYVIARHCLE